MKSPIFTGRIEKGKVLLDTPHRYLVHLSALEGKRVELVVRKQRSQRSIEANAYYWAVVIEILSEHLGYDKDTMHEALKAKFAARKDEKGLLIIESTSKMDTGRFQQYCQEIQRWSAEFLGIYIPDPNEVEYREAV